MLAAVEGCLRARGFDIESTPTRAPGHAVELAAEAAARGAAAVFVLGGDGTIREAGEGLLGSSSALAPLPGGTTNVLVRHLGLPPRPVAAAASYDGRTSRLDLRPMDVGLCNGRPFLMMTSLGLDARTMLEVSTRAKRRWGRAAIVLEGLRQLSRRPLESYRVRLAGREYAGSFVAVCNIAEYAGPFRLAPGADPADGCFEVVLFRGATRRATLGFALDILAGRQTSRSDVQLLRAGRAEMVEIEGTSGQPRAAAQIDGDGLRVGLPVRVEIAESQLAILTSSPPGRGL